MYQKFSLKHPSFENRERSVDVRAVASAMDKASIFLERIGPKSNCMQFVDDIL